MSRLLRPVPLLIISAFVLVALADLIDTVWLTTELDPWLLHLPGIRFEMVEPAFDLRHDSRPSGAALGPTIQLGQQGWRREPGKGAWVLGPEATFEVELQRSDLGFFVLECRPPRGPNRATRLELRVNSRPGEPVQLATDWRRYVIAIPQGALRVGRNRFTIRLPERVGTGSNLRSLHVRFVALTTERPVERRAVRNYEPVELDRETNTAVIRGSGILEIPFTMEDRVDAIVFRYRFARGSGSFAATVARTDGGGAGRNRPTTKSFSSHIKKSGRVRLPVHGLRGDFTLRIDVQLGGTPQRLVFEAPQFVIDENRHQPQTAGPRQGAARKPPHLPG